MMPTWGSPAFDAARARSSARERPEPAGSDSSTTVKPLRSAGQTVSDPGAGAVVVGGGGAVGVCGGPVETPGRVTVDVPGATAGSWAGPPAVATIVLLPDPVSARTMAAAAPPMAMTSPRSRRHTRSPGYQPKRRCQALDNRPAPLTGRRR